ncbi:MAG: transaldolase [Bacilli bacterium]
MNRLQQLVSLGQSPWLDYIRKDMLENGELKQLVDQGLRGVTSNPTIFENAIAKSDLYAADILRLAREGQTAEQIYETLVFADIARASDILRPVYDGSAGADGFVSLEVPPALCDDHMQTIAEARRLWSALARPNLMIKVPATSEGLLATQQLISEGINVNVTLMFTIDDYHNVAEAYLRGLERRVDRDEPIHRVASVASVFVSRIDSAVETLAADDGREALVGRVAVANARVIYHEFARAFGAERFRRLQRKGAQVQRPLWASTGAKNPSLSDVHYIDELIGPDTVNTMPPATLKAFLDHGASGRTVDAHLQDDELVLNLCLKHGIDLAALGADLKNKGLSLFADSFSSLMGAIERQRALAAAPGH